MPRPFSAFTLRFAPFGDAINIVESSNGYDRLNIMANHREPVSDFYPSPFPIVVALTTLEMAYLGGIIGIESQRPGTAEVRATKVLRFPHPQNVAIVDRTKGSPGVRLIMATFQVGCR